MSSYRVDLALDCCQQGNALIEDYRPLLDECIGDLATIDSQFSERSVRAIRQIGSEGSGESESEDGDVVNLPECLRGVCDLVRGFGADGLSSRKSEQLT